jgi:predicted signal transduction protein with EAL and GGDEF domain
MMRSPNCPIAYCWPSACSKRSPDFRFVSMPLGEVADGIDFNATQSRVERLADNFDDTLLKAVTGRLRNCVRETDTIARMGGDEFVILQCAATQPLDATSLAHASSKP